MDVSLLTVSRSVYEEALDACFETNTIRTENTTWPHCELDLIRHIDLAGPLAAEVLNSDFGFESRILAAYKLLPKLRTVTISCAHPEASEPRKPIRQIVSASKYFADIQCREVGSFEVFTVPRVRGKIWFKDFALEHVLPEAVKLASLCRNKDNTQTANELADTITDGLLAHGVKFMKRLQEVGEMARWLHSFEQWIRDARRTDVFQLDLRDCFEMAELPQDARPCPKTYNFKT